MCRVDTPRPVMPVKANPKQLRLLLSLESFDQEGSGEKPTVPSCLLTGMLVIVILCTIELSLYTALTIMKDSHAILQDTTNRQILARHIGVDSFSCFLCALLGWWTRHSCQAVTEAAILRRSDSMSEAAHEKRLYTYHPAAFRIALFFLAYQVKNLYDTILWNDGPEFVFHHIFSIITAYGCLQTGIGMMYSIFFFGLSEVSTAILCVLANFDDIHGVPGMGDAFPMAKVIIGGMFVVAFIACRTILWPIFSYYFSRDVLQALQMNDARTQTRRGWLKFFLVSLVGLSVLQVAWLGQIFLIAKEELEKVGLV